MCARELTYDADVDLLRLLTAGSVDDGKSTLIGRLLYDSKDIYEDHLRALERDSRRVGSAGDAIDYALLVDGLKAEREQGITIDVAYRYFATPRRKFIIADCPGHVQYTRNMATGASTANLAIILIDARQGVLPQTRRHSFIVSLLGIEHVIVAINKMDLVGWEQGGFDAIRRDYVEFAARLEVSDIEFVPMSALHGDNVVVRSERMPWYRGRPLLDLLETTHIASDRNLIDMRFPVQYVLRQEASFRGYMGTVASGVLRAGSEVVALPGGQRARIAAIRTYDGDLDHAFPPMAVAVALDRDIDLGRGDVLAYPGNVPRVADAVDAVVVWMAEAPLRVERPYLIKHGARVIPAHIARVDYRFDIDTLGREPADALALNEIGRVRVELATRLVFDPYARNRATGSFIVIDPVTDNTVGAGMILDRRTVEDDEVQAALRSGQSTNVRRRAGGVQPHERVERLGQSPATIWMTGLPRSGKTTIAYALERRLWRDGFHVHVLDGENLRLGISDNLGFGVLERTEHSRRAAHLARVCNDAGLITIVATVSPHALDRERARELIGRGRFIEVYLSAPVAACEARDDEGLYARARAGEIAEFTGVSSPYEPPREPDLELPTHELSVDEAVERVVRHLHETAVLRAR